MVNGIKDYISLVRESVLPRVLIMLTFESDLFEIWSVRFGRPKNMRYCAPTDRKSCSQQIAQVYQFSRLNVAACSAEQPNPDENADRPELSLREESSRPHGQVVLVLQTLAGGFRLIRPPWPAASPPSMLRVRSNEAPPPPSTLHSPIHRPAAGDPSEPDNGRNFVSRRAVFRSSPSSGHDLQRRELRWWTGLVVFKKGATACSQGV